MTQIALPQERRVSNPLLRALEAAHAWITRNDAIYDLNSLSDRTLADVGLERADIAARIDTEMNRIGRLGLGR